jgi:hypothetical protein
MNGNIIFNTPSSTEPSTGGNVVYNINLPNLDPALIEALKASPKNQELFNQVFGSMPQSVRCWKIFID